MRIRWTVTLLLLAGVAFAQDTQVTRNGGENPVDGFLREQWAELGIEPNQLSSDTEFLRRVTLDLTGTIPQPADVEAFLADLSPNKRRRKVETLLASDAFAMHWADRFVSVLVGYRDKKYPAIYPLKLWLTEKFRSNTPYNRIVRELITARGSNVEEPATAFVVNALARDKSSRVLTVKVSKIFLGIQLQCAQCHDHPFEPWTKKDFDSMVGFFRGTSIRGVYKADKDKNAEVMLLDSAKVKRGKRGRGRNPVFIDGTPGPAMGARGALADMITSPENLQFARATVNRIWAEFFGRGFVEPIDDFSSENRPVLPGLLDSLGTEFVAHNYDLRWLMHTIATSKAYQLSSRRVHDQYEDEEQASRNYAYQIVRPMSAEQTLNSLMAAQGTDKYLYTGRRASVGARLEKSRRGFMRGLVLTSGTENQVSPAEYNASIQQVMGLLNMKNRIYQGTNTRGKGRLARLLRRTKNPEKVIRELYLATVSREPSSAEMKQCLQYHAEHGKKDSAFQDIFFVLLNTNEFFFNH